MSNSSLSLSPARSSSTAIAGGNVAASLAADELQFPPDLVSVQDRRDEALLVLKSDLMAALAKEVKSLDEDNWMFEGPRSRIHLISRPAYRAYKAWDLSEKWDLELEIMDKTRLSKAMYKVICLSLMGQLLASLILPQDISEKNKNNQKEKKCKESYALVRERKAQMNEKREKLPEGSQDVPSENDILAQVMGKDKYGRVRMYGLGVSQSDVWGRLPSRKQSHRIAMEWKANCEQMEERFNNRIDELKSMFLRHRGREESISETSSPATSINHRPQITSTQLLRPFRVRDVVCLKSLMNPSETVAKGIIQSIDPSTQVGGEELGPNWCEVSIQVAVKKDERLIRSYGFHKTIYDAYGATVAWPCPY
ncbi:hypothetical protein RJ640_008097, partial [Escallonia rubra]